MLQSLQEVDSGGVGGGWASTKVDAPAAGHATGDFGECGGACGALWTFCPLREGFNSSAAD